jgi:hypothetical protein
VKHAALGLFTLLCCLDMMQLVLGWARGIAGVETAIQHTGARDDLIVVARPWGEAGEGDNMHGIVALESTGIPQLRTGKSRVRECYDAAVAENYREMFSGCGEWE